MGFISVTYVRMVYGAHKVASVERLDDQLITRSGNAPNTLGFHHRACLVLHTNLGVWEKGR